MRDQTRMLDNCLRRSGDPGFALHFGSRISVAALGELGYALMCCRNVQELMEVMGHYHRLISGSFRIEVESGRDAVSIRLVGGMLHDEAEPADCEIFFAAAAASLRQLCALSDDALSVTLAYPDPGYGEEYRRLICRDVRFAAPDSRLAVDRRYLDVPLQFANPTLLKLYRQQCDALLAALNRSAGFTAGIRNYLLATPGRFPPSRRPPTTCT